MEWLQTVLTPSRVDFISSAMLYAVLFIFAVAAAYDIYLRASTNAKD